MSLFFSFSSFFSLLYLTNDVYQCVLICTDLKGYPTGCLIPESKCGRRVLDGVFTPNDVKPLMDIASKVGFL